MKRRIRRTETGFTLIELIISLTLLATITGALVAALITTNNANANTAERIHESNDAQLTAGFWTSDAQAAGGIDPVHGGTDTTLGVLAPSDNGGCALGGGTEVIGFKWREWASRDATTQGDSYTTRVAVYVYRSSTLELERRTCADGAATGATTLASRVASVPTTSCNPAGNCPGLPSTVTLSVTETNAPATGPSPYQFTLTANVRSDAQTTRDSTNSQGSPLLILGGSCSSGAGLTIGGSTTIVINGEAVVNATDGAGCTGMSVSGNGNTYLADGTIIGPGGSCAPANKCPPSTNGTQLGNPFANLPAPSTAGCGGGANPSPDGSGNFVSGTYPHTLALTGSAVLNPGNYVLCNGISGSTTSRSTGVFLYVAGGSITNQLSFVAPATGTYQSVGLWIANSTPWNLTGGTSINIGGAVYAPTAPISVSGQALFTVGVLVAQNVTFTGNSGQNTGVTITGTGTPRSPILTATTGAALRTVNLSWVPQTFTGMSPITSYEYRADRGAGTFGAWSPIAGGAATTSLVDTCGSSNTVPTTCAYQVHAINAVGAGSPSNLAFADSAFDGSAPAVTITTPNVATALTTTLSGDAGNVAGDSTVVNVSLFDGATCTGTPKYTYSVTHGATWNVPSSGALTPGTKCVLASQSDTAGNVGTATAVFAAGLQVVNGGTPGRVDKGDTITISFPRAVNESTLCSTWTTNINQSITGNNVVTVKVADGGSGNDTLTVSTASGCTFNNLGSIDLGSPSWVNADTTFKGTSGNISRLDFTAATNALKITLGTGSGSGTAIAPMTMTYTPAAAIKDTVGATFTTDYAGASFVNERF